MFGIGDARLHANNADIRNMIIIIIIIVNMVKSMIFVIVPAHYAMPIGWNVAKQSRNISIIHVFCNMFVYIYEYYYMYSINVYLYARAKKLYSRMFLIASSAEVDVH